MSNQSIPPENLGLSKDPLEVLQNVKLLLENAPFPEDMLLSCLENYVAWALGKPTEEIYGNELEFVATAIQKLKSGS